MVRVRTVRIHETKGWDEWNGTEHHVNFGFKNRRSGVSFGNATFYSRQRRLPSHRRTYCLSRVPSPASRKSLASTSSRRRVSVTTVSLRTPIPFRFWTRTSKPRLMDDSPDLE